MRRMNAKFEVKIEQSDGKRVVVRFHISGDSHKEGITMTNKPEIHEHDLGFAHDLPHMIGRRQVLRLVGGAGILAASSVQAFAQECTSLPWETAGPFPADGTNARSGNVINVLTQNGVIREDIRTSFGAFQGEAEGLPFNLEITLLNAADCAPLKDHAIYIWHCDALGRYSIYDDAGANYLRGVGIIDEQGQTRFTTIFPGCYQGRWPHIHFEVFENIEAAISGRNSILTSQMAMPEDASIKVYQANPVYAQSVGNFAGVSLGRDMIFADNSAAELQAQIPAVSGDAARQLDARISIAMSK